MKLFLDLKFSVQSILLFLIGLTIFSCSSQNSFETSNGNLVTYFKSGDGNLPGDTLIGLYHFRYAMVGGVVFQEAEPDRPLPFKTNLEQAAQQGDVYEVLTKLKKGDSVRFEMEASEIFGPQLPDTIAANQAVEIQISVMDLLSDEEYGIWQREQQAKLSAEQNAIDAEIIDAYLAENNIEAESTESGLRYKVHVQGTGPKPTRGQTVSVDYTGMNLSGEIFDTSNADRAQEAGVFNPNRTYEPYAFPLETGSVIQGWHIGIAQLNEGSKATLYIPSSLGYGPRGSGGRIPPNAVLVFDVELVEIQ